MPRKGLIRQTVDLFKAVDHNESYNEDSLRYTFYLLLFVEVVYAILFLFEGVACAPFIVSPPDFPDGHTLNATEGLTALSLGGDTMMEYVNSKCAHELKLYMYVVQWMVFGLLVISSFLLAADRAYVLDLNALVETQPLEEGIEQRNIDYSIQKLVRKFLLFKIASLIIYMAMLGALWAVQVRELAKKLSDDGISFICGGDGRNDWQRTFPLYGAEKREIDYYSCSLYHGSALIVLARVNDVLRAILILRFIGAVWSVWSYRSNCQWREFRARKLEEQAREMSEMQRTSVMAKPGAPSTEPEELDSADIVINELLHQNMTKKSSRNNIVKEMAKMARQSISMATSPVRKRGASASVKNLRRRGTTTGGGPSEGLAGREASSAGETSTLLPGHLDAMTTSFRAGIGSVLHSLRSLESMAPGTVQEWLESNSQDTRAHFAIENAIARGSEVATQTYKAVVSVSEHHMWRPTRPSHDLSEEAVTLTVPEGSDEDEGTMTDPGVRGGGGGGGGGGREDEQRAGPHHGKDNGQETQGLRDNMEIP